MDSHFFAQEKVNWLNIAPRSAYIVGAKKFVYLFDVYLASLLASVKHIILQIQ